MAAPARRGVKVRVMLNPARRSGESENEEARKLMADAGVDVRVLDGGLAAWTAAGYGLDSGDHDPAPGDITITTGSAARLPIDEVLDFATTAFVSILILVDPPGTVPAFMALTVRYTPERRRKTALVASTVAALTLLLGSLGQGARRFLCLHDPVERQAHVADLQRNLIAGQPGMVGRFARGADNLALPFAQLVALVAVVRPAQPQHTKRQRGKQADAEAGLEERKDGSQRDHQIPLRHTSRSARRRLVSPRTSRPPARFQRRKASQASRQRPALNSRATLLLR